jgi:hypothetical protein
MMRMSGPPLYTELDLLVMATRSRIANDAVEALLRAECELRNISFLSLTTEPEDAT